MGLLGDSKVKAMLVGLLLTIVALVGVSLLGLFAALSALGSATGATPLAFVLLSAAAPYIVIDVLLGLVVAGLLVGLSVAIAQQASMPRNDRLARMARKVEGYYPQAESVGLSERVEPTTEDRIDDLKEQYVNGELSEAEYERRLQNLMDDEDVTDERVRREQRQFDKQFEYEQ